jgi:hypothetical protein
VWLDNKNIFSYIFNNILEYKYIVNYDENIKMFKGKISSLCAHQWMNGKIKFGVYTQWGFTHP